LYVASVDVGTIWAAKLTDSHGPDESSQSCFLVG